MARSLRFGWFVRSVIFTTLFVSVSYADDSGAQATTLDLWLNSAPADLLVGEIAEITGRKSDIDGDLEAVVSGRYTGTARSILDAVAREHPILFDIDEVMISAVSEDQRTVSSIVTDEMPLDDAARESITARLLSGNSVEFTDNEIVVTGHPRFVNRTARQLSSALADQGRLDNTAEELADKQNPGLSTQTSLATMTAIGEAQQVTDAASAVVLSDIEKATDAVPVDGQATVEVSDIDGNSTNSTLIDAPGDVPQTTLALQESMDEQPEEVGRIDEDRSFGSGIKRPAGDESLDAETLGDDEPSRVASERNATPREYRWVTDIPGFDTF